MTRAEVARDWFTSFFLALLSMAVFGYRYPSTNHGQEVLPIYRIIDPELFGRDFAVVSFDGMGPRTVYNQLLALLALYQIDYLPHAFFALFVLTATLYAAASRRLGRLLGGDERWGLVLFGGLVTIRSAEAIGGNSLYWEAMMSSFLAGGLCLWGFWFTLRAKPRLAYLMFGVAALFQIIVGSLAAALVTPYLVLATERSDRRRLAVGLAIWLGLACLVAVPTLLAAPEFADRGYDIVETFGWIRVPHHWVASTWPVYGWAQLAGLLVFLLAGAAAIRREQVPLAGVVLSVALGTCAALVVNYLVVEVAPVPFLAKLQLGRSVPFVQLAVVLVVGVLAARCGREGRWLEVGLLVMALPMAAGSAVLALLGPALALEGPSRWRRWVSGGLTAAALVVFGGLVADDALRRSGAELLVFLAVAGATLLPLRVSTEQAVWVRPATLAAMIVGAIGFGNPFPSRIAFDRPPQHALLEVAREMRARTPKDTLFLAPLIGTAGNELMFSFESQRASVVQFKNIPFSDAGIQEWRYRLETVLGVTLTRRRRNMRRLWLGAPYAQLLGAAQTFDADYLVIERGRVPASERLRVFYQSDRYAVVAVPPR